MKKLMLVAALLSIGLTSQAKTSISNEAIANYSEPKWEKSTVGTWEGPKKTWYKLEASLWTSIDGKKWEASKDGLWQDKGGKWLKIVDRDLKWSADGGKTWSQVPDRKWEGNDGVWNKFDKDWSLLIAKK